MPPTTFDFQKYLSRLSPQEEFEVEELRGGLVNVTARITRKSEPTKSSPDTIRNEKSFIMKYAPGYVAAIGEAAPFSTFRQIIEMRALKLFTDTPPFNTLQKKYSNILIPRLLHHDPEEDVLIISDLGDIPTLNVWIETSETLQSSQITEAASFLGSFFADFHLATTPSNRSDLECEFKNEDMHQMVSSVAVDPILKILDKYDVFESQNVFDIIQNEFKENIQDTGNHVLNLGDLWTGSVLVESRGTRVGVIDWEFATLAPPGQDVGQFAAHLSHHVIVGTLHATAYSEFSRALLQAYGGRLVDDGSEWVKDSEMGKFLRGIRILYGRELINSTTWDRKCHCHEPQCKHDKEAVEKGVQAVLSADSDPLNISEEDFLYPLFSAIKPS